MLLFYVSAHRLIKVYLDYYFGEKTQKKQRELKDIHKGKTKRTKSVRTISCAALLNNINDFSMQNNDQT
ncbi:MAG: hypothetical protein B7C24_11190 [Bacteroidetes bacterium 4572_77]|nr:MAG: hypothetical protein B7C24_11190 [Bacteroidetes bacterium 4572_77]